MYMLLLINERKTNSWEEGGVLTYKGKELLSGNERGKKSRVNEEEKSGDIKNERLKVSNHLDMKEKGQ